MSPGDTISSIVGDNPVMAQSGLTHEHSCTIEAGGFCPAVDVAPSVGLGVSSP